MGYVELVSKEFKIPFKLRRTVRIGNRVYDLDDFTKEQHDYLMAAMHARAITAMAQLKGEIPADGAFVPDGFRPESEILAPESMPEPIRIITEEDERPRRRKKSS